MPASDGEASVRTRRGRCVVAEDEIRLEEGLRGHLRTAWSAYNSRASALTHVVASLLVVSVVASAVRLNRAGDPWAVAFNAVLVVYAALAVAVALYARFVRETGIERIRHDDVLEIRAVPGGASPPRLVVVHRARDGLRRRVVLPTTPGGDDAEAYEDARRALRAAGHDVAEGEADAEDRRRGL